MNSFSMDLELRHELTLTPKLLQSLSVLQMNAQELLDFIDSNLEENPCLELEESVRREKEAAELLQKFQWLDGRAVRQMHAAPNDDSGIDQGAYDAEFESLFFFLKDQIDRLRLPRALAAVTEYLARLLDEDGYLDEEDLDALERKKVPRDLIEQGLTCLQSLSPSGVGARSLSECLLLQLTHKKNDNKLAEEICRHYLHELGAKKYRHLARILKVTEKEIEIAAACIAELDPKPGYSFQPVEKSQYILPDVFVVIEEGKPKPIINEYYIPSVILSKTYIELYKSSEDPEVRSYLQDKIHQAKWLIDSLSRRGKTLLRCVNAIVETQSSFFLEESDTLAPMTLTTLSDQLGVHVSTVSRTIRGKYLQCRRGSYPISYFFNRALGTQEVSNQEIQQRICLLIEKEDPDHPYSDEKIKRILASKGIYIARRTVAQYRAACGIPSSFVRKREK